MPVRQLALRAAVLLLVAYALLGVYAAASTFWLTPGSIGLVSDYGATVRAVAPDGPAARAGIAAGDRIRLSAMPFEERRFVSGAGTNPPPGMTIDVAYAHGGADRSAQLTAVAAPLTAPQRIALFFLCAASLVFIAVGATLILVRPSYATWGFGLYCLLTFPAAMYALPWPSAGAAFAATMFYDVIQNAGVAGLLLFVLEFPRRFDVPWRARIRALLPAIFIVLAAMTLYPDVANLLLARGAEFENRVLQGTFGAVFVLAMIVLGDSYRRIEPAERERVRWVLLGFGAGLLGSYVGTTLIFSTIVAAPPLSVTLALTSLNVLLPLAVAHAVIRHRVLEIRVVIERALVFVVLTTILATIFALLDYLFGTLLEDFRISRWIAAAISLGIAFTFKWLEEHAGEALKARFFDGHEEPAAGGESAPGELALLREENERQRAQIADLTARLEGLRGGPPG
jgi:hypothetical protein